MDEGLGDTYDQSVEPLDVGALRSSHMWAPRCAGVVVVGEECLHRELSPARWFPPSSHGRFILLALAPAASALDHPPDAPAPWALLDLRPIVVYRRVLFPLALLVLGLMGEGRM